VTVFEFGVRVRLRVRVRVWVRIRVWVRAFEFGGKA
jgi:hypothetical protein